MDLHQLRYFISVAENGSFTRGAAALGLAQSVLSHHVGRLERELGQSLLYRNGRGVTLTDAGRRLLEHGRGILHQVQNAETELAVLRGRPVGRVAIALGPSLGRYVSADLVLHCRRHFPEATVALHEGQSINILEWLTLGRVDIGLTYGPPASHAYHAVKKMDILLMLISPALDRLTRHAGAPVLLSKVGRLPLIMLSRPDSVRLLVEDQFEKHGLPINIVHEVDEGSGIGAVLDLVERGEGHAILPAYALNRGGRQQANGLSYRRIARPALSVPLVMALPNHRPMTILTKQMAELLMSFVPNQLKKSGTSSAGKRGGIQSR